LTSTRERNHVAFIPAWYILPKIMTSPLTLISPNKICQSFALNITSFSV
jgi:hypothetical protein